MPKGGARTKSGPPPDPQSFRQARAEGEWVTLPADGREGGPPAWPLEEPNDRELALWADAWARPQAIMWERNRLDVEVALYVRNLAAAEVWGAAVNRGTLVRQQMDSLGLTTPGMRANRWRIVGETAATAEQPKPSKRPSRSSSVRDRLTVVPNGGA